VGNPKHADIFLVTGTVNRKNQEILNNLYLQIPEPKVILAVGTCALSGGIFAEAPNVIGGVDKIIPVDIYIPGCPPKPEAILEGVLKSVELLEDKVKNGKI